MFESLKGRKLYRSPKDSLLFGVCSGLGHYLQIDVVFVRLGVIVLAFLINPVLVALLYVIAVAIMPLDPLHQKVATHQEPKDVTDTEATGERH